MLNPKCWNAKDGQTCSQSAQQVSFLLSPSDFFSDNFRLLKNVECVFWPLFSHELFNDLSLLKNVEYVFLAIVSLYIT